MSKLIRSIRTPGAILMGLGAILGTGIFVSLAFATQVAGNGIIISIIVAGILAIANGLSSAQLAAAHPVSGGTYEYGYRFLGSYWGFSAGWMFLLAKSASAATAVIGTTSYLFQFLDIIPPTWVQTLLNLSLLIVISWLVSGGIKRSNKANIIIVSITLFGLAALVGTGLIINKASVPGFDLSFSDISINSVFYASALMFVAFTGYGRIATLGEEVEEPERTIPRAIIFSLIATLVIYISIAVTAIGAMGTKGFGDTISGNSAPLVQVADSFDSPLLMLIVSFSAITAMIGVLLNLLLGISRVVLGMARRQDIPEKLSKIEASTGSPARSVWVTCILIGVLVLSGDIRLTWSFSAFTVLIYYAITNLSALKLPPDLRLYPRWITTVGLSGCLFLAFFVDPAIWITGISLLIAGLVWHYFAQKLVPG